jgi:2-polyprenyl-3-methyl-5-hydroxy-6-metoxy-1,4-benzoquinol methylase
VGGGAVGRGPHPPPPNPQSPIPNPQSPFSDFIFIIIDFIKIIKNFLYEFIYLFMEDKTRKIEFSNDKSLSNISLNYIHFNNSLIKSTNVPENTDLISGKYEGGIKIWECDQDLLEFLPSIYNDSWKNKNILDMGCGHGLPGIYLLLKGINEICFQDFNKEVLDNITKNYINQLKNNFGLKFEKKVNYVDGDWGEFQYNKKFDIIISGDTLYNNSNYEKIYNLIKNNLNKDGEAYFASKRFYFGVGGGSSEFRQYISDRNEFQIEQVKTIKDGINNIRVILKITWK